MSEIELYLIRHGKTQANIDNKIQGWTNEPLIDDGRNDLKNLAKNLKNRNVSFDVAFTSDSIRSIETSEILLKYLGSVDNYIKQELREWNFGSLENKDIDKTLQLFVSENAFDASYLNYENLADYITSNDKTGTTESWFDISYRVNHAFREITSFCIESGYKKILIVSHGLTIGTFLKSIDSKNSIFDIPANGELIIVRYDNGVYTVKEEV